MVIRSTFGLDAGREHPKRTRPAATRQIVLPRDDLE